MFSGSKTSGRKRGQFFLFLVPRLGIVSLSHPTVSPCILYNQALAFFMTRHDQHIKIAFLFLVYQGFFTGSEDNPSCEAPGHRDDLPASTK